MVEASRQFVVFHDLRRAVLIGILSMVVLMHVQGQKAQSMFEQLGSKSLIIEKLNDPNIIRTSKLKINKSMVGAKSSLPANITLELFPDVSVGLELDAAETSSYKGLEIYRAKSNDPNWQHLDHYRDATIIYNPHTDNYVIQMSTSVGSFEVIPSIEDGIYLVSEWSPQGFKCRTEDHTQHAKSSKNPNAKSGCEEKDKDGVYVADLFIGYSYEASYYVQDYDAHALSLTEEVNNGLINSNVRNIRIRLVGTGISDQNPGVVPSVLGDFYTWFADEIAATAADYVAAVQVPTGASNEAGGWAGVGGYSSVNSVHNAAAVFRHELGHNIGSGHCTPGILPYAAGYDTGNVKTHMCGNNTNFYSTPLVNDAMGLPLGDAVTADNARVWRERAAQVSARRRHTIKYDDNDVGCQSTLANGRYHIQNINSNKYLATLNESTSRGTRLALADNQAVSNEWDLMHIGNGKYRIQMAARDTRRIDVPGGTSAAGADLIIWSNNGSVNQDFSITEIATEVFTIKTPSGQCVQVENTGNTNGDPIEQNSCDDSDNTKWRFIPVDGYSLLQISISTQDTDCNGLAEGSATVTASGGNGSPYTYEWSNGEMGTNVQNNLAPGLYTVTVSDGATTIPYSFQIVQTESFITTISVTKSSGSDGSISISATGGQEPYIYQWSNGSTGATINNLAPGLYTVSITDGANCQQEKQVFVLCSAHRQSCDDGNVNTIGDVINEECECVGIDITCNDPSTVVTEIAQGKTATQSGTHENADASKAVDGNTNGDFHGGSVILTNQQDNPWWEVDLKDVVNITSVAIWNRTDYGGGRVSNAKLFVSEVPFESEDILETEADPNVQTTTIVNRPNPVEVINLNQTGRYIRIQSIRENDRLNFAELQVYTCQACIYYADNDGDGFGDIYSPLSASCLTTPIGYVANSDDCDDNNSAINPNTLASCSEPITVALTANPLGGSIYELIGYVKIDGRSIDEIHLEHGSTDFSNSTITSAIGHGTQDSIKVSTRIDVGSASQYQFKIKAQKGDLVFESDPFVFETNQSYCTGTSGESLWYKRFDRVEFNGLSYKDNVSDKYEDVTDFEFGTLDPGQSYPITIKIRSTWFNLRYLVLIDLNNDGDFSDYNEEVGEFNEVLAESTFDVNIPNSGFIANHPLRMRIIGWEASFTNCSVAAGNIKDFTVQISSNTCADENYKIAYFGDADGDGYGMLNNVYYDYCSVDAPDGTVINIGDCNDSDPVIYPNAPEICGDGKDNDCDGFIDKTNIASTGLATQSSTLSNSANPIADKAIDGNASGDFSNQSTTHTNSELNPWWELDLGSSQFIESLSIWNRTDCCTDRLSNFFVFLSEQPFTSLDPATLASDASVESIYQNTTPVGAEFSLTIGKDVRYIRIQRNQSGVLSLAEVQVFTCEAETFTFYKDVDEDGFGDLNNSIVAAVAPMGYVDNSEDCDDTNDKVYPNAPELCDGIDNDCDGDTDEDNQVTWYADVDKDGYGSMLDSIVSCAQPTGYISDNSDCDDSNASIGICSNQTTNINELYLNKIKLSVAPNPASNVAYAKFELDEQTLVNISITRLDGSIIEYVERNTTYGPGGHQVELDLSRLRVGMYLIRFRTARALVSKKLIILD